MMQIPKDKTLHFVAGFFVCVFFSIVNNPITGLGGAIAAGIMKECYDEYQKENSFDVADMFATWIGGCVGFALVCLVNYWKS